MNDTPSVEPDSPDARADAASPAVAEYGPQVRRTVIIVLVSLLAIALAVAALQRSELGAETINDVLTRTQVMPLLLAIAVMSVGMSFMALRWRALIPDGHELPVVGLTAIVCAGLLLNYALPGPVGEVAVAVIVHRRYGTAISTALAAGIFSRFLGLASAGALAGGAWLLGDLPVPEEYEHIIALAAVAIAVGAMGLGLLSARPKVLRALSSLTAGALGRRLPDPFGASLAKLDEAVARVAEALGTVGRLGWKAYAEALFWAMMGHAAVPLGIWIAATSMGLEPHPPGVLFTYCAATAGVVGLFAIPGAQFGWDAMFCSFFTVTTGVTLTDALAVTLVVRIQQLLLLLGGALALTVLSAQDRSPSSPAAT